MYWAHKDISLLYNAFTQLSVHNIHCIWGHHQLKLFFVWFFVEKCSFLYEAPLVLVFRYPPDSAKCFLVQNQKWKKTSPPPPKKFASLFVMKMTSFKGYCQFVSILCNLFVWLLITWNCVLTVNNRFFFTKWRKHTETCSKIIQKYVHMNTHTSHHVSVLYFFKLWMCNFLMYFFFFILDNSATHSKGNCAYVMWILKSFCLVRWLCNKEIKKNISSTSFSF